MAKEKKEARRPRAGEERFAAYLEAIVAVLGHASRAAAAQAYCTGLLLPGERKSIEPMAARMEPGRVQAKHQSLHHVVAKAEWDDAACCGRCASRCCPPSSGTGRCAYWIVDDTSFPKKGKHSVGVARQYCGELGKQDNCQVAVSLSVANDQASLPVAWRLYLPEAWAEDPSRRAKAGVPEAIGFQTKTAIALGQMRRALEDGVPEASCWPMPATAMRPISGSAWRRSVSATCWASGAPPRSGPPARRRCRPRLGPAGVGRPRGCGATRSIARFR